ncbi:MAG: aldo/keto reductase [Gammaproteobacteria bacterium]|nr:aldo/keto reductase [Gammaproteobacteria bacterium]NNJ49550.1 aldo/keto reductase [Gammaproteobacteria bacterium]
MPVSIKRRQFIQYLAIAGTSLSSLSGSLLAASDTSNASSPAMASSGRHMRIIPSSGEKIPAIGLGSWLTFAIDVDDEDELARRIAILREFLQQGGGVLDSSPMYGVAQEVIGKGLKRIGRHDDLFSATKVWTTGNRQGFIQMEASRQLWGLEQLDLMQVHNLLDWETHLPTLHAMKQQKDIRYLGVTTSHGRRHEELEHIMRTQQLDFVQFTYNIIDREAEEVLLPLAKEKGIAVIINRPFQRGGLFKKFERYPLPAWANEIDCMNWAQFFLKFIISHPAVSCAIPATSQIEHLRENIAAGFGVLPDEVMRKRMLAYINDL